MDKAILVIDSSGSQAYLVDRFRSLGYQIVQFVTFKHASYCDYRALPLYACLESEQDVDRDIARIQAIEGIDLVGGFYGNDTSAPYADEILSRLFPGASNNPKTSQLRHDKFVMNKAIAREGICAIPQVKLDKSLTIEQKIAQTRAFFRQYQEIVIKPSAGSGASVGVYSPVDEADIAHYFEGEHSAGLFFQADTLLQKRIIGEEYYIDAASYQGRHEITSIGKYKKDNTGSFEYQYFDNIHLDHASVQDIKAYVLSCLSILGMDNGLSHTEVMVSDEGIYLIELNPRISGGKALCNVMAKAETGIDQIDAYHALLQNEHAAVTVKNACQRVHVFKNKKGLYTEIDLTDIARLPSYAAHYILQPHSTQAVKRNGATLLDSVMYILLACNDSAQLEVDSQHIFELEKTGTCLI